MFTRGSLRRGDENDVKNDFEGHARADIGSRERVVVALES